MPSRTRRSMSSIGGSRETTRAGRVLVFGGDEVYPYPSRNEYEVRTETPYAHAFAGRAQPEVFAIPGNHDWYDSLVAFSRTFCRPERGFASCKTRQTRSYFALQVARQLVADRPSTCNSARISTSRRCSTSRKSRRAWTTRRDSSSACPSRAGSWKTRIPGTRATKNSRARNSSRRRSSGARRRCSSPAICISTSATKTQAGVQKITSGGGGAFLHPTHAPKTTRAAQWLRATRRLSG